MNDTRGRMKFGTSSIVVAAFIGPGTVLTCATAGLRFGYELVWVVVFATAAVFVLQSFTAGSGILAGKGLGEAIREAADTPVKKSLMFGLVILGLGIGCAAFESGNIAGATAGFSTLWGIDEVPVWAAILIAAIASVLLMLETEVLIRMLAVLVGLMSVLFIGAALIAPIDWSAVLRSLFIPSVPDGGIVTAIALVGTTIVTYNLFLHPSAAKTYWQGEPTQLAWRQELLGMALFIPLGGVISLAILLAGGALAGGSVEVTSVADFAMLLEPVAGSAARYFFGFGLLAAGLTSAVTAPMAAAAGISELFGWNKKDQRLNYRIVWAAVIATGLFFNLTGISPLKIIIAAQAANGLLLPLVAGFVLYLAVKQQAVKLPAWYLLLGAVIVLICTGLGIRTLAWVWGQLGL